MSKTADAGSTASSRHSDLAGKWFRKSHESLNATERAILSAIRNRTPVAHLTDAGAAATQTFGERMADRVAEFGGSWTFIGLFAAFLVLWAAINTIVLTTRAFDPYPFIFLNLILSMVAALQAPIIMMSQNRQTARDRAAAAHDYAVNLKAELEIMGLHEKFDDLRTEQITRLLEFQQQQMDLLTGLVERGVASKL